MKSVTEFFTHKLLKGLEAKTALANDGKTPEEIQQSLGESFKLEGDKLKYFFNSLEVAEANKESLARILVVSLAEGETIPPKSVKVEEHYYIPEFQKAAPALVLTKAEKGGSKQNKGKRKDGPKSSPWGISPEEAAAKKATSKANAAAKSK